MQEDIVSGRKIILAKTSQRRLVSAESGKDVGGMCTILHLLCSEDEVRRKTSKRDKVIALNYFPQPNTLLLEAQLLTPPVTTIIQGAGLAVHRGEPAPSCAPAGRQPELHTHSLSVSF